MDQLYYIRDSRQTVGNCVLWWGPNRRGYTCTIREAGLYGAEAAKSICANRDTDHAYAQEFVESNIIEHVRVECLHGHQEKFDTTKAVP